MHHIYAARFDVIGNLKNFWELNKASARQAGRQAGRLHEHEGANLLDEPIMMARGARPVAMVRGRQGPGMRSGRWLAGWQAGPLGRCSVSVSVLAVSP